MFESRDRVGGHTNTIPVTTPTGVVAVDTGFIVFNDRTYPQFISLMDELGVPSQPTQMSFSVQCATSGLEYRGADFAGLFAQRRNLLRPKFYRLLADIVRFNRIGESYLAATDRTDETETVDDFFQRHKFSDWFREKYFLPMGAAIWSSSWQTFRGFPIRFIMDFYRHHGLLGLTDRPNWRVIVGGSSQYIAKLTAPFAESIRTGAAVTSLRRIESGQVQISIGGDVEDFDHVILACHSDQALRILGGDATDAEREILSCFPYQENLATLHTDASVLPKRKSAWACWNYAIPPEEPDHATLTYNMNLLQSLDGPQTYCVTLGDSAQVNPEKIIRQFKYAHPTFQSGRSAMQGRHGELIDHHGVSYCGAYWGNGFHEDGVRSSRAVCDVLLGSSPGPVATASSPAGVSR